MLSIWRDVGVPTTQSSCSVKRGFSFQPDQEHSIHSFFSLTPDCRFLIFPHQCTSQLHAIFIYDKALLLVLMYTSVSPHKYINSQSLSPTLYFSALLKDSAILSVVWTLLPPITCRPFSGHKLWFKNVIMQTALVLDSTEIFWLKRHSVFE